MARRSSLGRVLLGLFVAGAAGLAVVAWRAPGLLVAGADAPAEDLIRPVRKGGSARPRKAAPKPEDRPAAAAEPAGKETSPASGKAAATDRPPAYTEKDLPRLIARADKLMAEGREAEAVETLEAARRVAPAEFAVLDRLEAARRVMQERRTAEERLADGKEAFAQGSYEDALRDFYRVPERFRPPRLDRWIANGWYNLGVLALQRGDVVEAAQHFRDALELSPGDAAAQRNLEVTRRYRQRGALDDAYRIYVSELKLRSLDD
ncbi:MAG: tetratricopeptide repeat protein [Acidobacteria bacterium]|nr:MAG: tetratricopeptide repeat protein [Acidobacteriota bacterium]